MNESCQKPNRVDAEKVVRIICMIVSEAVNIILALRGGR